MKITYPVGEWTAVESGDVTGYVKTEYILTGAEAQTYAENLVTEARKRKEKKKQKHLPMQCPENLKKRR